MSENRFAHLMLAPAGLWLLLLFAVPLGIVLAVSLGTTDPVYQAVYGWHPQNFADVFDPLFAPVLLRSVGYALATVVLCLLIGYPIAYYIARFGGRWKTLLIAVVVLPFLVNYLVRTYAWVAILSDEGLVNGILTDAGITENGVRLVNTSWAVIGGLVYGYLAFMILPLYAALDRMDPSLIEAGKDLYGTRWQTFWHVTWPAAFQGVVAGLRAGLSSRRRRLHLRPAARRPGHLHGREPDPAAVPRGSELALRSRADDRDDGLPADLDADLRALHGAGSREATPEMRCFSTETGVSGRRRRPKRFKG